MAGARIVLESRDLQRLVLAERWIEAKVVAAILTQRIPREADARGLYAIGWMWFMSAPLHVREILATYNDTVRELRRRRRGPEPGDAPSHEEYDSCIVHKIR